MGYRDADDPIVESGADRIREAFIAGEFLCHLNDTTGKEYDGAKVGIIPGKNTPDFRVINKETRKVVGYIEIKDRSAYRAASVRRLGGCMLSADKYRMLRELCDMKFRVAFVVCFKEGIGYWPINTATVRFDEGGNKQTGNPHDIEEVALFDHDEFIWITEA